MHCIRGFIGKNEIIEEFADCWVKAKVIILPQGYSLILLTVDLDEDIVELVNSRYDDMYSEYFYYLSPSIYEVLEERSRKGKIVYFETDYFGGAGSQSAVLFENGCVKTKPYKTSTYWDDKSSCYKNKPEGEKAINIVLKELGVYKEKGKDEFDSINLGHYRRMDR